MSDIGDGGAGTGDVEGAAGGAVDVGNRRPLARATGIMAIGTTVSRVTGMLRIFAVAYALGAGSSVLADSYNLANTMPNMIHDVVLGGVLSATFVPVFVQWLTTRPEQEAWEAISAITSVTMIIIAAASVLFLAVTPFIIDATTFLNHGSQAAGSRTLAIDLLFLFVPQLTCYGFISLGTALLNARRKFGAPMFTPIANNLVLVVVLLVFGTTVRHASVHGVVHDRGQLLLLGLGTTAGVVVQAGLMIPSLRRAGLHLTWRPNRHHPAVTTILRLSGWTFGLVAANQVALFVVLALSIKIGPGAVSAYTYAFTFFQLPYGVVAVSVMSATAPELSALWSVGNLEAFRRRMGIGLRAILAIVLPAAAGMLILARPLVALLLGWGAARGHTATTASALAMLCLGLPGFCVFLYAIRVLQSVQDLRSAFWLYVLENGVNIVAAVVLAGPLGVRGIALSISIAYSVAAVAALVTLRAKVHGLSGATVGRPLAHVLYATVAVVLASVAGNNLTSSTTTLGLIERVVLGTVAGIVAYVVVAGALAAASARRHGPGHSGGSGGGGGPFGGGRGGSGGGGQGGSGPSAATRPGRSPGAGKHSASGARRRLRARRPAPPRPRRDSHRPVVRHADRSASAPRSDQTPTGRTVADSTPSDAPDPGHRPRRRTRRSRTRTPLEAVVWRASPSSPTARVT